MIYLLDSVIHPLNNWGQVLQKDISYKLINLLAQNILDPGLSTSRTMWVIPALKPTNAVKCGGKVGLSLGKDLILPLWCVHLFRGRKPNEP